MRKFRAFLALLLTAALLFSAALAEAPLLRHADGWDLTQTPLTVTLHAGVSAHMPFDDERLAMLTAITNKVSFRISTDGPDTGSLTILVGNSRLLTLTARGQEIQLSSVPKTVFRSENGPVGKLLGTDAAVDFSQYGLLREGERLLEDGWTLLDGALPEIENYGKRTKNTTSIKDMGKAGYRIDATIPSGSAHELKPLLLAHCPEGALYDALDSLVFEGKQTFRIYLTAKEVPLRIEYNGKCGPEDDLRTVQFIWRMRRDETHRNEVTLTAESLDETRKDTVTYERVTEESKKGAVTTEGEFSYTRKDGKEKSEQGFSFELKNTPTAESDVLSGSFTLTEKPAGEDKTLSTVLQPELEISGTQEEPVISGILTVTEKKGKNVTEDAVLQITLTRGEGVAWPESETIIDLDSLTEDELLLTRQDAARRITSSIVRPLIIFLGSEGDWFFRDLSPEAVQNILDAASSFILIE